MYTIKHTPPEQLSAAQRRAEIASILATGLARLRSSIPFARSATQSPDSEFQLANVPNRNVHTNPVNSRQTEA